MPQSKQIKPGDKVGLKLTDGERKLVLNDLMCMDKEYIQTVQDTPAGKPVQFTLNELDDFGGYVAAEANHTEDKKFRKKLDRVFEKVQSLLDQYTDSEPAPAQRVLSPSDDADREKAVKTDESAAGILSMADRKEPKGSPDVREEEQDTNTVYGLKITLDNIEPPVWRRVQVEDCTLADLHIVIQVCMGWYNSHLHMFSIDGKYYSDPEMGGGPGDVSTHSESLAHLVDQGCRTFSYTYDFGDSWEHTIEVEDVSPAESKAKYPRCVEGKRACPPEDCGGPWGYPEFLEAIQNPKHEEHEEMLEWVGGKFDPKKFSAAAVNKDMRKWLK